MVNLVFCGLGLAFSCVALACASWPCDDFIANCGKSIFMCCFFFKALNLPVWYEVDDIPIHPRERPDRQDSIGPYRILSSSFRLVDVSSISL